MKLDDELKSKLISTYRTEIFETDNIDIKEIDGLISDDALKIMISLNNAEMSELINKKPLDKERIERLFIANINFYRLARYRKMSVPGSSFLMSMAGVVGYNVDKLYDELTVGRYKKPSKLR